MHAELAKCRLLSLAYPTTLPAFDLEHESSTQYYFRNSAAMLKLIVLSLLGTAVSASSDSITVGASTFGVWEAVFGGNKLGHTSVKWEAYMQGRRAEASSRCSNLPGYDSPCATFQHYEPCGGSQPWPIQYPPVHEFADPTGNTPVTACCSCGGGLVGGQEEKVKRQDECQDFPGWHEHCLYFSEYKECGGEKEWVVDSDHPPLTQVNGTDGNNVLQACCSCSNRKEKSANTTLPTSSPMTSVPTSSDAAFEYIRRAIENAPTNGSATIVEIEYPFVFWSMEIKIKSGQNIILRGSPNIRPILDAQNMTNHITVNWGASLSVSNLEFAYGNKGRSHASNVNSILS